MYIAGAKGALQKGNRHILCCNNILLRVHSLEAKRGQINTAVLTLCIGITNTKHPTR